MIDIAHLEQVNYLAQQAVVDATPGMDLVIRDDVILATSAIFPTADANHACGFQTTHDAIDGLLDEVLATYQAMGMPVHIYVSPANQPSDLTDRLLAHGFEKQDDDEAWLICDDFSRIWARAMAWQVDVEAITSDRAFEFAHTFALAFDLPTEMAQPLADLLLPSMSLDTMHHFMATIGGQAAGTITLLTYGQYGIVGSMGTVPGRRNTWAMIALGHAVVQKANELGLKTLMLQTAAKGRLCQFLKRNGFYEAFQRYHYMLA